MSFDRTNITDPNDDHYHVVCYPMVLRRALESKNLDVIIEDGFIDGWGEIIPVEFYKVSEEEWRLVDKVI